MTSVTIVESRNYVTVNQDKNTKKVPVPKKPDKTPRFEFYLYNDAGRIIKQYLTIHEIQQILLQQSQNLGINHKRFSPVKVIVLNSLKFFRIEAARLADWSERDQLDWVRLRQAGEGQHGQQQQGDGDEDHLETQEDLHHPDQADHAQ